MKAKITAFMNELILYDYILFGSAFVLFILFIVLGIILRRKVGLSVFLIILAFLILTLTPTLGYLEMHKFLFKNTITLTSQKKLNFTKAIVIKGKISNDSKFNFKSCKITASAFKVSKNPVKKFLYPFKPLKKMSIIQEDIPKGETKEFKMFIEPFTYSKDYNVSLEASCK